MARKPTPNSRDDLRERGFAEARRAEQQGVVHRLAARARGFDEDFEIGLGRGLANEFVKAGRAERTVRALAGHAICCNEAFCFGHGHVLARSRVSGLFRAARNASYAQQPLRRFVLRNQGVEVAALGRELCSVFHAHPQRAERKRAAKHERRASHLVRRHLAYGDELTQQHEQKRREHEHAGANDEDAQTRGGVVGAQRAEGVETRPAARARTARRGGQ